VRRTLLLAAALASAIAVWVAPARAITGNFVEDFVHPYVGLIVFYDANGEFLWRCSGTLISERLFLTAGHCTEQDVAQGEVAPASARIYFRQDAGARFDPALGIDPLTGYPEECRHDPTYALPQVCVTASTLYDFGFANFAGFPNIRDVGIAVLDQPVTSLGFAPIAEAGSLDALATQRGRQEVTFTVSGYGVSRINPVQFESFRERLMATTRLVNLRSALTGGFNLQTSAAPGGGRGGTCFGDSGGPVFWDATNIIVAVTSFGLNANCRGVDFAFRIDQQVVIEWILDIARRYNQTVTIVPLA
jgi:hypothetical protein